MEAGLFAGLFKNESAKQFSLLHPLRGLIDKVTSFSSIDNKAFCALGQWIWPEEDKQAVDTNVLWALLFLLFGLEFSEDDLKLLDPVDSAFISVNMDVFPLFSPNFLQ